MLLVAILVIKYTKFRKMQKLLQIKRKQIKARSKKDI